MTDDQTVIKRLDTKFHNRKSFASGIDVLDDYLKTRAGQEQKRNLAFCYALTFAGGADIRGYYTLSATGVVLDDLPAGLAKQTRYELVPAVLIGRLALDASLQGKGHGKILLIDALRRIARSDDFAVKLVIVRPKDQKAADFYAKYGFAALGDASGKMYIPFDTIKDI